MSAETNKAIVRRFYEEIDKGNLAILDELVAPDYLNHSPRPFPGSSTGTGGVETGVQVVLGGYPGSASHR